MVRTISILAVLFTTTAAFGADLDRERKVRVALAMQAAAPTQTATAPQPRAVAFPNYATGYAAALAANTVQVTYIGCRGKHQIDAIDGAVVSVQTELPPYLEGTIVVAYPLGGRMMEHKKLQCEQHAAVKKEVEAAHRKIEKKGGDNDSDTPKPLQWQIKARGDCSFCGDNCKCKDGKCPNQCAVAEKPAVIAGAVTDRIVVGYTYQRVCNGDGTCRVVAVPLYR